MARRILVLALSAALFTGCSGYREVSEDRLATMTQRYANFDLRIAWDTKVEGGDTLVYGAVKNVRYAFMHDLEVWVAALNPAGKETARSVSYVIPSKLDLDETASFSLKLPLAAPPGTRLRFTYKYRGSDGGGGDGSGGDGTIWWQNFEISVPAK